MATPITQLSPAQLRQAAAIKERIQKLEKELASLIGASVSEAKAAPARKISAAGRARIAAAQRARWAKFKAAKAAKK